MELWNIRLEASVVREAEQRKLFPSMTTFFQKVNRKKYSKIESPPPPEPKKYAKKLPWGNTISSPRAPPQRRKRSDVQVQRPKKKQYTLYSSFIQNKASQTTTIRHQNIVHPTSITNISTKRQ